MEVLQTNINGFTFLIQILKKGLNNLFSETIKQLIEQNKNLLNLI
jgi:hypothetical protein